MLELFNITKVPTAIKKGAFFMDVSEWIKKIQILTPQRTGCVEIFTEGQRVSPLAWSGDVKPWPWLSEAGLSGLVYSGNNSGKCLIQFPRDLEVGLCQYMTNQNKPFLCNIEQNV